MKVTKVSPGARMERFAGTVAAVTGSARGIGKNIARAFARERARVIICDVDERNGKSAQAELCDEGLAAEFLCVDLAERGAPQETVRRIIENWGRLDILVNNARAGERRGLFEETEDTWQEGLSVTLRAAFFASQELIRSMAQNRGGSIVNIGSVAALMACNESPVYHIAKAGMAQMTRYLAVFGGVYGCRVNAVLPGFIVQDEHRPRYRQENNRHYRELVEFCHPTRNIGSSDDVASAVLFLCSLEASFISGQLLVVDGGAMIQEQTGLILRWQEMTSPSPLRR